MARVFLLANCGIVLPFVGASTPSLGSCTLLLRNVRLGFGGQWYLSLRAFWVVVLVACVLWVLGRLGYWLGYLEALLLAEWLLL